jgi:hypothetical protein
VICPKCGENNSENFRYCGMCGTSLEVRRPAGAPRTVSSEPARTFQSESSRAFQNDAVRETPRPVSAQATASAVHDVPPTAGPSFLGLNQPFNDGGGNVSGNGTSTGESFSGLDSFFEPEERGVSARGIIFLLVLLAGLGAGGWWAYTHYNGSKPANTAQTTSEPPATQSNAPDAAANTPAAGPKAPESSSPNPASSPNSSATEPTANSATESASTTPPPKVETPAAAPKTEQTPPASPKPAERAERAQPARNQRIARAEAKPAPRPSAAVPASGDKGDAEFKRGEAYLYGRGMPENCDQAIRNLKDASAKQNAKARSTFGTMYATGHCVPRNLPTSYSWFAQALRADPNNQILEKDLTAVWNQMTPPERQVAARAKP